MTDKTEISATITYRDSEGEIISQKEVKAVKDGDKILIENNESGENIEVTNGTLSIT